jgi:hypothetical protein
MVLPRNGVGTLKHSAKQYRDQQVARARPRGDESVRVRERASGKNGVELGSMNTLHGGR